MIYAGGTHNQEKSEKRKFDKMTADTKTHSFGDYVWAFQNLVSPKETKKLLKKWRGPFEMTEVHQGGRFFIEHRTSGSLRKHQATQ